MSPQVTQSIALNYYRLILIDYNYIYDYLLRVLVK